MIAEAKKSEVKMPWARGARRTAFIATKAGAYPMRRAASA